MSNLSNVALPEMSENVTAIALAEFGDADKSRHRDLARDLLRGHGRDAAKLVTKALLAGLIEETEKREAERLEGIRATTDRSTAHKHQVDEMRRQRDEPPAGFRVMTVLDEATASTIRVRIPEEWVIKPS